MEGLCSYCQKPAAPSTLLALRKQCRSFVSPRVREGSNPLRAVAPPVSPLPKPARIPVTNAASFANKPTGLVRGRGRRRAKAANMDAPACPVPDFTARSSTDISLLFPLRAQVEEGIEEQKDTRPLAIYLPSLDGTGQGIRPQLHSLEAAGYEVACLYIPASDRSTWAELSSQLIPLLERAATVDGDSLPSHGAWTRRHVTLVAESFGGVLAFLVAAAVPRLVDRLVVLNPATHLRENNPLLGALSRTSLLSAFPLPLYRLAQDTLMPLMISRRRVLARDRDLLAPLDYLPAATASYRLSMLEEDAVSDEILSAVTQPVLLLASARDRFLPSLPETSRLASLLPCAQRSILIDSGHSALLEDGIDLARLMLDAGLSHPPPTPVTVEMPLGASSSDDIEEDASQEDVIDSKDGSHEAATETRESSVAAGGASPGVHGDGASMNGLAKDTGAMVQVAASESAGTKASGAGANSTSANASSASPAGAAAGRSRKGEGADVLASEASTLKLPTATAPPTMASRHQPNRDGTSHHRVGARLATENVTTAAATARDAPLAAAAVMPVASGSTPPSPSSNTSTPPAGTGEARATASVPLDSAHGSGEDARKRSSSRKASQQPRAMTGGSSSSSSERRNDTVSDAALDELGRWLEPWKLLTSPCLLGLENLPSRAPRWPCKDGEGGGDGTDAGSRVPILFVGNHTMFGLYDAPLLVHELHLRGFKCRGLAHGAHWSAGPFGDLFERYGCVPASPVAAYRMLSRGEHVLLFPGGGREVAKRKGEEYQLMWRGGGSSRDPDGADGDESVDFVRMAARLKTIIVPFAALGGDDAYKIAFDSVEMLASPAGPFLRGIFDRLQLPAEESLSPITYLPGPFGHLPIPSPLPLPYPERVYFYFGKPFDTQALLPAGASNRKDSPELRALYKDVRAAVEDGIRLLTEYREKDPERSLGERLRVQVADLLPKFFPRLNDG
eukprot:jgi/Mesvir1/28745/Mv19713-RA.1